MDVDVFIPPGLTAAATIELGTLAESVGIRAIRTYNYIADPDPFVNLSWLAHETTTIRMGPVAVSPFQLHPLMMANSLLTLNELSHGRADIVVGGGGAVMAAMGLRPKRKLTAVRECVEFLRQAAASRDKPVNFKGELYTAYGYQADWLTQRPPRIHIGANGPQMASLAARLADGMMMSDFTVPMVEAMTAIAADVRAKSTPVADKFRINNFFAWHIKRDKNEAISEARRHLVLRGILRPQYLRAFMDQDEIDFVQSHMGVFWEAWQKQTGEFPGVPETMIDRLVHELTLTGDLSSMDRQLEELERFRKAGLTAVALGLHEDPAEGIRQIGKYVIPALQ
jgi:alkanesulfonate monooxygenase SsuD/methylene tetrahydromethanopterin reductase-like flavin-dependent oxidoreductase (luciferase family)